MNYIRWLVAFVAFPLEGLLLAEEKLSPGKDRIDTPAVGNALCVHNLFQSGMVVQRDMPIPIWGWAAPGEVVTVVFGDESRSCNAAADRSWKVELPAMPASAESRSITVRDTVDTIELTNILVGDVWVLAGPSTMARQERGERGSELGAIHDRSFQPMGTRACLFPLRLG